MDHMIQTLRGLFRAIWREQNRAWCHNNGPNKPSNDAKTAHEKIMTMGVFANQMEEEMLLNRLPSDDKLASDFGKAYLLLPPSQKASRFASLMWMEYDLSTTPVDVHISVTMFCHDGSNLELPFRLERGGGIHDFYHAQLGNKMLPKKPGWLPESQPSFPLCANCPVTLVIALLLTLYGLKETARILNAHEPYRIERYKKQLEPWVKV